MGSNMSELLTCISRRISHVISSKFPGTAQAINAVIRSIEEEPEKIIDINPQLYIRLVNEFSNLHLILIVSFPNENWIYEILAALQGSEDLTRVLLKNRDQIIRYCDEQPVEASSTRINAIEEALMRNASCH
ncbi:MAG: hypothetical protein QXT59_08065 [Zestosphaera sp.]